MLTAFLSSRAAALMRLVPLPTPCGASCTPDTPPLHTHRNISVPITSVPHTPCTQGARTRGAVEKNKDEQEQDKDEEEDQTKQNQRA